MHPIRAYADRVVTMFNPASGASTEMPVAPLPLDYIKDVADDAAERILSFAARPSVAARFGGVAGGFAFAARAAAFDPITLGGLTLTVPVIGVAAAVTVGVFAGAAFLTRRISGRSGAMADLPVASPAKAEFEAEVKRLRGLLEEDRKSSGAFAIALELDGASYEDKLKKLRLKGEVTKKFYDDVKRDHQDVVGGIEGFERHIKAVEDLLQETENPTESAYRSAIESLRNGRSFKMSEVGGMLFEPEEREFDVNEKTIAENRAKAKRAQEGFRLLMKILDAPKHKSEEGLPLKDLADMKAALKNAGVSDEDAGKVLAGHPLTANATETYQLLNGLADSDPMDFHNRITALRTINTDLKVYVELLAEDFKRARAAKEKAEATEIWQKAGDDVKKSAAELWTAFVSLVQSRSDAENIDAKASEIVAFYADLINPSPAASSFAPPQGGSAWGGQDTGWHSSQSHRPAGVGRMPHAPQAENPEWQVDPFAPKRPVPERAAAARDRINEREDTQRGGSSDWFQDGAGESILDKVIRG